MRPATAENFNNGAILSIADDNSVVEVLIFILFLLLHSEYSYYHFHCRRHRHNHKSFVVVVITVVVVVGIIIILNVVIIIIVNVVIAVGIIVITIIITSFLNIRTLVRSDRIGSIPMRCVISFHRYRTCPHVECSNLVVDKDSVCMVISPLVLPVPSSSLTARTLI